jgi:Na+-transporting NADH:ubiquinone oxidoreductase subunit NqrD
MSAVYHFKKTHLGVTCQKHVLFSSCSTPGVSKATQIALASVLANLANSTTEKKSAKSIELANSLVVQLASLFKSLVASADPDVIYRLLVALGCALVGSNGQAYPSAIPSITQDVLSHYTQDFITECCLDIKRNV